MKPSRAASIRQWGAIQIVQRMKRDPLCTFWIDDKKHVGIDADALIEKLKGQDNRAKRRKGGP